MRKSASSSCLGKFLDSTVLALRWRVLGLLSSLLCEWRSWFCWTRVVKLLSRRPFLSPENVKRKNTWIVIEPSKVQNFHNGSDSQWGSANKRGSTGSRSRSWSLHDSVRSLQFYRLESSAINTVVSMSGPVIKSHIWAKMGKICVQYGRLRSCCCPRIVTELERKFVFHIVTAGRTEYLSKSSKITSQIISKMQKCQHSQTLLKIQIRNVPWKWQPGRTVFILTSRQTKTAKSASEPRLRKRLSWSALAEQYFGQDNSVTW